MVLIYILLLVIIVFCTMSFVSLVKLNKQNTHSPSTDFGNDKYYELKYKLQFISSVGVIIIGVGGFLGYDKFDSFVSKFEDKTDSLNVKIDEYNKRISLIDTVLKSYDFKIDAYNMFLRKIEKSRASISMSMRNSNKQLSQLTDTIDNIKKRNILDKSFYVVDNLLIPNKPSETTKFYFKDMITIIGDKLPAFEKKPVLFIIPQSSVDIAIKTINTEYIEVGFNGYSNWEGQEEPKNFSFGILISKRLM